LAGDGIYLLEAEQSWAICPGNGTFLGFYLISLHTHVIPGHQNIIHKMELQLCHEMLIYQALLLSAIGNKMKLASHYMSLLLPNDITTLIMLRCVHTLCSDAILNSILFFCR
jgi:hypothetical protein